MPRYISGDQWNCYNKYLCVQNVEAKCAERIEFGLGIQAHYDTKVSTPALRIPIPGH
jgi:hypothetical protein